MDIGTLIGIAGVVAMMALAIISTGASILYFIDIASVFIVVLGSWFCIFTLTNISGALNVFSIMGLCLKVTTFNEKGIITKLMAMSEKARREGLLALEEELEDLEDEFLKKGLRLVVDGTDAEIIRNLMENELSQTQARHAAKISVLNIWASLAPAFGMMGTVVGLIGMLRNLEDKSSLGPNMAVALVTTLYGALMTNAMFLPMAGKLTTKDAAEALVKELQIEGVLSIQAGDNPRILAMKLLSYLEPEERKAVEAEILKD